MNYFSGDITTNSPWFPDETQALEMPFKLSDWIEKNRKEVQTDFNAGCLYNKSQYT